MTRSTATVIRVARRWGGERTACRDDVLAVVRPAGRPDTVARVAAAFRGKHGAGTVVKALAELTAARALVNPRDQRGYRLPEWVGGAGSLFPDPAADDTTAAGRGDDASPEQRAG